MVYIGLHRIESRWGNRHYLKLCTWIAHRAEKDGEEEYTPWTPKSSQELHLDVTFSSVMQSTSGMQPREGCHGAWFASVRNTESFA